MAGGERAGRPQLLEHRGVVVRRGDDPDVLVVLGGGAHHGRAADVDELDGRVRGERVQVRDHQVDGVDAVGLQVGQVLGLGAVGQDPAVDLGVEGLDPSAQHLGRAGDLGHLDVGDAGLAQRRRRVAAGHQLPPQVREALGQLDQAFLVVDRQQRPHDVISCTAPSLVSSPSLIVRVRLDPTSRFQLGQRPGHGGRVQGALDHLDPLVQRLLGVAGEDGDHLLGQDRPGVHLQGGQVHGAPRLGHAGGQGVTHPVPARERREQGRVRVQDPPRKGPVDGLAQHGPEAGHGHQVDLVRHQRGRHGGREAVPVEFRAEAAIEAPVDELGGRAVRLGEGERGAGAIREDGRDRQPRLEHGLQDRPGTRDKDSEAHGCNLMRGRLSPGWPQHRICSRWGSDLAPPTSGPPVGTDGSTGQSIVIPASRSRRRVGAGHRWRLML